MRRTTALTIAALLALATPALALAQDSFRVLVYTRTTGFRHDSIPDGVAAVRAIAPQACFAVEHTEDPAQFTPANLARFRVVVFLNTTGDVLDAPQQAAFESFIRAGNGYVGVHSAADTEFDWPFYAAMLGALFSNHPNIQPAQITVEDPTHPATAHLPVAPATWNRTDEWYNFRANPRAAGARILARIDESTYSGGQMGADHPIAWCRLHEGGRALYTAGGHTRATFAEPLFRQHLLGAITWAAGYAALPSTGCPPACRANFDATGPAPQPDIADLFAFLSAWFAAAPAADFDGTGGPPNLADLFTFLAAWFAGC